MFPSNVTSGHQPREGLVVLAPGPGHDRQPCRQAGSMTLSKQHEQTVSQQLTNTLGLHYLNNQSNW